MVKQIVLADFTAETNKLLTIVNRKIVARKVTTLNEGFDSTLKVDLAALRIVVETILTRIRKAETIYYTYLEDVDHSLIAGTTFNLPLRIEIELEYKGAFTKFDVSVDDRAMYKEMIDNYFHHYILVFAAIYENIVRLCEVLVKKVIVHLPKQKPISTPLVHYIGFFDLLNDLGYRRNDQLTICINNHAVYLKKYLEVINNLRNSYIHGFKSYLASDGANYRMVHDRAEQLFGSASPDLNIDLFSYQILHNTKLFFEDLLKALQNKIQHPSKILPA